MLCFGHQARDLAPNIRRFRQFTNLLLPWREDPGSHAGLGKMIEDETLIRKTSHQLNRRWELFRENENVIGEIELLQLGDAAQKLRREHEFITWFILHHVPHSDKFRIT